jgi:hypothetical protein
MQVNYPPNRFSLFAAPPLNPVTAQPADAAAPITPTLPAQDLTDLTPFEQQQELAANALQNGSSTAPAQGGLVTGLARLGEAISGGYQLGQANKKLAAAKKANAGVMEDAVNSGDWAKLATADSPVANKLGDALLQAQLKHLKTDRILTPDEVDSFGYPKGTVVSTNINGEQKVLNRPLTGLPKGYKYGDDGEVTFIPGGPADPVVISKNAGERAKATQAAKPKAADDTGTAPWLRKW